MRLIDCQRTAAPTPTRAGRTDLPLLVGAALLLATLVHDPRTLLPASALLAFLSALTLLRGFGRPPHPAPAPASEHVPSEIEASVARLAASEEHHRSMIEHASIPILTLDLAETITSMNRAAEIMFGWNRELLVGQPATRLLADASVRALRRWTRGNIITPSEPLVMEIRAAHHEGRIINLEAHPALLRTGGVPLGVELVCRDVTARATVEQLRDDFLAMIGHDIRNPLGAIFGYTEMMLDPASALPAEHRDLVLRINTNSRTVLTLVGNFLDASRIEAGRMTLERRPVDMNVVAQRIADQYTARAQMTDLALHVSLDPDVPAILADELQIERVAANLFTNALKFTPRGGTVTLRTERLPSSVALAVSDTGVGIPQHEFARIFQRYARNDDGTHEGTGLGLYIVGTLVEAHGGFVTIDSMPGSGTTFTVYLPIIDWRPSAVDAAKHPTGDTAVVLH